MGKEKNSGTLGPRDGGYNDNCLAAYDAAECGKNLLTSRTNRLSRSSMQTISPTVSLPQSLRQLVPAKKVTDLNVTRRRYILRVRARRSLEYNHECR
jgi:hypothetical protein